MAKAATMSKTDAVREALKANVDGNVEISAWAKEKYNLDIDPKHISVIKWTLKNKKPARKTGRKPGPKPGKKAKAVAVSSNGDTVSITDLEAVRALTGRLGAVNVKRLVDIVG